MSLQKQIDELNEKAGRLLDSGLHQAALQCLERAIGLAPQNPSLVCNYALVLNLSGNSGRARKILQRVAEALPEDAESRIQLARLLVDEQPEVARGLLKEAREYLPETMWLRCLWAEALMRLGEICLAASGLEEMSDISLNLQARSLLADLLCTLNRADDALRLFCRVQPADAASWAALSRIKKETGDIAGALLAVEQAMCHARERPELIWNQALLRLMQGDYLNGWPGLQARWRCGGASMAAFGKPPELLWQGESLVGKAILVWEEQGFGDTLQFIRYVGVLTGMAVRIMIEAREPLRRLLASMPNVEVYPIGEVPHIWDYHVPTWSLAELFAPSHGFLAEAVPYFKLPTEVCVKWRYRLGQPDGRLRIGLVWAGGEHADDPIKSAMNVRRSISLRELASALQGIDCHWISLQTFPPESDQLQIQITDFSAELGDFLETAGLLMSLDVVIAVDTAVAHLAGALGRPVILLNRIGGCWRWGCEGGRTDWYPSMRIVRQSKYLDWHEALVQLPGLIAAWAAMPPQR